jgi:hypothetical protein
MAFYSKSLYRDIAVNWSTGFCFLYLLSLLALYWIPGMIRMDADLSTYIEDEAPKFVNQLPSIVISKGQASIDGPQPSIIKYPEKGDAVMIVDTTGQITSLENSSAIILVTKTQLFIKDSLQGTRILNLSELGDMTIDKALVYDWLEVFSEWFAILVYPFALLFSFAFRSAQVLIYALIGMLFSQVIRVGLNYQALMRLAAIALTPVIIFNALMIFFKIPIPSPWLINAIITTGYLIFAIRACSSPADP